MLMGGRLGGSDWRLGTYSLDWREFFVAGVVVMDSGDGLVWCMGIQMVLPHWRAYAQGLGVELSLSDALEAAGCEKSI